MEIYNMDRGNGKTTQCIIELARNPKAVLLTGNTGMKRMIIEEYSQIRNISDRVFAPFEIERINRGYREGCEVIIDELDYVLESLLNSKVKFATITEK